MRRKRQQAEQGNPHRVLSTQKVDAILAGAMQEFLTHGYAATTMDRVTAAAGVSKTTVYSYFQDKEGLFTQLIEQLSDDSYHQIFNPEDPLSLEGETEIVLRRIAINFLDETCNQVCLNLVRVIIGESGRFPRLAQIFLEKVDKRMLVFLTEYFTNHPELQLPDPEVAARIFTGSLIHFMIIQDMFHGKEILPMERDRLIDNLIHLLTSNQNRQNVITEQYSGTRQKSSRRQRNSDGKFQQDYISEPKRLHSIRLTDTAWEKLAELASKNNLTRSEMIEVFARSDSLEN